MIQLSSLFSSQSTSLFQLQRQLQRSTGRMASGKRIQSGADAPGSLGAVQRLRALEKSIHQGIHGLGDGNSLLRVADSGLADIGDSVGRMRELAIRAQNGTLNDADRGLIQIEYDQLAAGISSVAGSTRFNGHELLNGGISGNDALTIADHTGDDLRVDVADHSAGALGIDGLAVGDATTVQALDAAIDTVSDSRGQLAALSQSVDTRVRSHRQASSIAAATRSRIEDADLAAEASLLARNRILQSASISVALHDRDTTRSFLDLLG